MKTLTLTFDNSPIHTSRDGWFNATDMANVYGKKPIEWIRLPETEKYIEALCDSQKVGLSHFIKTRKGKNGGTWLHRKLVIRFAQWLDVRFAIWCDDQIEQILSGSWQQERDNGIAYRRMMTDTIQEARLMAGNEVKPYHFMNETKLVCYAITGQFKAIDRDTADKKTLSAIKDLESYNSALIGLGLSRDERKPKLCERANKRRNRLVEALA